MKNQTFVKSWPLLLILGFLTFLILILSGGASTQAQTSPQRRVNAPYFGSGTILADKLAVFWLGEVGEQSNYADVRIGYNNTELSLVVHTFDKWLWTTNSPSPGDMENWDAVSVYLQPEGNSGTKPSNNAYRFILQLDESSNWEAQPNFQAAYRWQNSQWLSYINTSCDSLV